MADVFLSYAKKDRAKAKKLAKFLEGNEISVFWDRDILPGATWDEVIERELENAAVVVVLWSYESIKSRWVKVEAEEGAARGVLVPAMIEDIRIPLAFRSIQAVDLTQSSLSRKDSELTLLLTTIGRMLGQEDKDEEGSSNRIKTLIQSLSDSRGASRISAAKALERIGSEAREAIPSLIKALDSDDLDFLDAVVDALDAIDLDRATPALERLYERLSDQRGGGEVIDGSEPEDDLLGKLLILVG